MRKVSAACRIGEAGLHHAHYLEKGIDAHELNASAGKNVSFGDHGKDGLHYAFCAIVTIMNGIAQ